MAEKSEIAAAERRKVAVARDAGRRARHHGVGLVTVRRRPRRKRDPLGADSTVDRKDVPQPRTVPLRPGRDPCPPGHRADTRQRRAVASAIRNAREMALLRHAGHRRA